MAKNKGVTTSVPQTNNTGTRVVEPIVQDGKIVADSGDQDSGVRR